MTFMLTYLVYCCILLHINSYKCTGDIPWVLGATAYFCPDGDTAPGPSLSESNPNDDADFGSGADAVTPQARIATDPGWASIWI